jgi:hypothetical protein
MVSTRISARRMCVAEREGDRGAIVSDSVDVFVDFKGWRFRAPFRCLCCGIVISVRQFCFGRDCATCDIGNCRHPNSHCSQGCYSGPRELIDINAKYFISEDRWLNPATGLIGGGELPTKRNLPKPRPLPRTPRPPMPGKTRPPMPPRPTRMPR